jgi:hypothetical protein
MKNGVATLEGSLVVSYRLNIVLPYDLAIVLGICPNKFKTISTKLKRKPTYECLQQLYP